MIFSFLLFPFLCLDVSDLFARSKLVFRDVCIVRLALDMSEFVLLIETR